MPLILPVHVICNTSDEQIYSNIRENSRRPGKWVKLEDAHDGVAILCGSGPSIGDFVEEIREKQKLGGVVFAMNGAAKFLSDNGILADYQVIIDARPETAQLVGPAKEHLFASQVHPDCFEKMPSARVWHLQVGNIENEFPEYANDYCLIGGAASVGNTATCLAYAMGFRSLQIYGYDSSHRGSASHAFRQPMNDGDPCCVVNFNGREYLVSLTMKLQAEKFQETARALISSGCKIEVHGDGLLQDMFNAPAESLSEREKYQRMWTIPSYRNFAPGEECVDLFIKTVKPTGLVIDFGAGTGRGAIRIKESGCDVLLVDFTSNSRDQEAMRLPFLEWDLTELLTVSSEYGYCTDVMEHIPPCDVEKVVNNIMAASKTVFFQISTVPDNMGALINQHLHLTVQPHRWWKELFERNIYAVKWEEERPDASLFVVTTNKE